MNVTILSTLLVLIGCTNADVFNCYFCNSAGNSEADDLCDDSDALIAKGDDAKMNCGLLSSNNQCMYSRTSTKGLDYDIVIRGCAGSIAMENDCTKSTGG